MKHEQMKHTRFVDDIIEILVQQGVIKINEAAAIIKAFQDSHEYEFDAFLVDAAIVTPDQLLVALAKYYKVPSFDVVGHFFESSLLHKFPKQFLLYYGIIPLEDDENTLVLVASNPHNNDLLLEIGQYVSYDIQFRVGLYQDIVDAIKEFYDAALTEHMAQDIYDEPDIDIIDESRFESVDQTDVFFVDQDEQD